MHPNCIEYRSTVAEAHDECRDDTVRGEFLPKHVEAERRSTTATPQPRIDLWSRNDPVTVLGAKESAQGWAQLEPMFKTVAGWFSDSVSYEFELIAAGASGDLAYTVGYEHNEVSVDGTAADLHAARHTRLPARRRRVAHRPSPCRRPARGRHELFPEE